MKIVVLVCSLLLFGISAPLLAQDKPPLVTIYLKNGQKIEGYMKMSIHEGFLTLEHDSLSQTHLAFPDIKKIYFGEVPNEEPQPYYVRQPGYFHLTELALQFGSNDYEANVTPSIHTVNGYAFSPHLMTGLGLGWDHYGSVATLPMYLSVRGIITDRKVSPYYFANAGVSLAWPTDDLPDIDYDRTQGGLYLHGGLGYQINLIRSALLLSVGYKLQKTDFAYDLTTWEGDTHIEEKRTIRRLTISFGYSF